MPPFDSSHLAAPHTGALPHPLGRHREAGLHHDPRSRQFPAQVATPRTVEWKRHNKVLDQGQVGSCTGNATVQALNHDPFWTKGSYRNEAKALEVYTLATQIDPYPGSYPATDTGSDGLSVAKAALQLGWVTGYTHAFGAYHVLQALPNAPLIIGSNWHQDMFTPDSDNIVHPSGAVAGGHEYVCDGYSVETGLFRFLNSWGNTWGDRGHFYMTLADFDTLLDEGGDAVQFVVG